MEKKLKVAVLMGGKSAEHEVSLSSGTNVLKYLNKEKYQATPVVIKRNGSFAIPLEKLSSFDVVFIALHGPYGEDGTIQGLLKSLNVPYTGSGVLASALGMNKIFSRKIFQKAGISIPKYQIVEKGNGLSVKIKFPVVVKPNNQGSSVGVSIVKNKKRLQKALNSAFKFGSKVIIEEHINGIEISCGILGNSKPVALPVAEIVPKNEFFDYEAKYNPEKSEEIIPAGIPKNLTKKVQETAICVFKAIGASGFARVDMILKGQKVYVLEINTIPGLTPNSILPKEAAAAGISYFKLLDWIIKFAVEDKKR